MNNIILSCIIFQRSYVVKCQVKNTSLGSKSRFSLWKMSFLNMVENVHDHVEIQREIKKTCQLRKESYKFIV
jgi:hypothetical protein